MFEFFDTIYHFITVEIFEIINSALVYWGALLTKWSLQWSLYLMQLSWDIGKQLLIDLNISSYLLTAWNDIPPDMASTLAFFKIPESVNIILSAGASKLAMNTIKGVI